MLSFWPSQPETDAELTISSCLRLKCRCDDPPTIVMSGIACDDTRTVATDASDPVPWR